MVDPFLIGIASNAAKGVGVVLLTGAAAQAAVPYAMSAFGTVVSGVGTLHAPAAANGIAASLQVASHALFGFKAVAGGAAAGAGAGQQKIRERAGNVFKASASGTTNGLKFVGRVAYTGANKGAQFVGRKLSKV